MVRSKASSIGRNNGSKQVSFHSHVRIRHTLHINDYTREETQATWMTKDDLTRFRQEAMYTIDLMNRGCEINESLYCRRGLEFMTKDGKKLKQKNKHLGQMTVFSEQEMQELDGVSDPELLSELYEDSSYPSRVAAYVMGLSDMKMAYQDGLGASPLVCNAERSKSLEEIDNRFRCSALHRGGSKRQVFSVAA